MALITKVRYIDETGIKESTLDNWIQRKLVRGTHFVVQGRTTLMDREAMDQWLRNIQPASGPTETEFRSDSAPVESTPRRSRARTPPQKLQLPQRFANGKT